MRNLITPNELVDWLQKNKPEIEIIYRANGALLGVYIPTSFYGNPRFVSVINGDYDFVEDTLVALDRAKYNSLLHAIYFTYHSADEYVKFLEENN